MCTWPELVSAIQARFPVRETGPGWIRAGVKLPGGRQQIVRVSQSVFRVDKAKSEVFAAIDAPIVEFSGDHAGWLLSEGAMPVLLTSDGMLSAVHHLCFEGLSVDRCMRTIGLVAETAHGLRQQLAGGSGGTGPAIGEWVQAAKSEARPSAVIGSGQWVVGQDLDPGLYRFVGFVERLDRTMSMIMIERVKSGLGLVFVSPHDGYVRVNGELVSLAKYPVYDVLEQAPRDGIYLVGVDLPRGRYRIHARGRFALCTTYGNELDRIKHNINEGSLIVDLDDSVFAVGFEGRIEPLP